MSTWTDERVEKLKKLWAEGFSCSQIAKHLGGVTRNAVIGKVDRLGLLKRAIPSAPKMAPVKRQSVVRGPKAVPQHVPIAEPIPEKPWTGAKVWTDRQTGECAYIVQGSGADAMSCCKPCEPIPDWAYCGQHMKLMTSQRPPKGSSQPSEHSKLRTMRRRAA